MYYCVDVALCNIRTYICTCVHYTRDAPISKLADKLCYVYRQNVGVRTYISQGLTRKSILKYSGITLSRPGRASPHPKFGYAMIYFNRTVKYSVEQPNEVKRIMAVVTGASIVVTLASFSYSMSIHQHQSTSTQLFSYILTYTVDVTTIVVYSVSCEQFITIYLTNLLCLSFVCMYVGDVEPASVFMIVMFSIALFLWILSMFFDFFSYMMPTIRLKLGKVQMSLFT